MPWKEIPAQQWGSAALQSLMFGHPSSGFFIVEVSYQHLRRRRHAVTRLCVVNGSRSE